MGANVIMGMLLMVLPLHHMELTSGFGYRLHPVTRQYAFHAGVDLRARSDTIYSVLPGLVRACDYDPFLGVHIRVETHQLQCSYGHLSQIFVLPGDSVLAGTPIGITGYAKCLIM
ncbi:MAG: M23 family metallopeptidase [Bacteroidetes bacterium]|nr:M23 family metallopeptidase [Bacteroidota bacterium]